MCYFCGKPITAPEPIGRSAVCEYCGKDLRACKNCRHVLGDTRGKCAEAQAESVKDQERANFCDWFGLDPKLREGGKAAQSADGGSQASKQAFDNLFS
jgi:hypothetical protein